MRVSVADMLATLRVAADLKSVQDFHKELKATADEASGGLRKGLNVAGKAVAALGAVALGAAGALVALTGSVTAQADQVAKGARSAGMAAEEYQRLGHIAELSGTNIDVMRKSVQFLRKGMDEFASKKTANPVVEGLARIGLTADDLAKEDPSFQIGLISDALTDIVDPAERATLRAKIFGEEGGPQMASLLDAGSDAIAGMYDSLDNVFTDEQLTQAEAYQDSMTELGDRVDQAKTEIAFALVPALLDATGGIEEWIGENETFIKQDLPAALGAIVEGAVDVITFFADAAKETKVLYMQLQQLDEDTGALTTAWELLSAPFRAVKTIMEETAGAIKKIVEEVAKFLGLGKELEDFAAKYGLGPDNTPRVSERGTPKFLDAETQARREQKEQDARIAGLWAATDAANAAAAASIAGSQQRVRDRADRIKRAKGKVSKKGGSKKSGGKEPSLEDLVNAATGEGSIDSDLPLDEIAKRAPTVVVQITNNKIDLHFDPHFPNVRDPDQAATQSAKMVTQRVQEIFDQTGQRIAPVRIR